MFTGYGNIDKKSVFYTSQSSLRGHSLKLNKKRVRLGVAKFSFSNREVNEWNILDDEIISGCLLAGLKHKLDRHLRDKTGQLSSPISSVDEFDSLAHQVQVHILQLAAASAR